MKNISAITLVLLLMNAAPFAQNSAAKYNVGKFSKEMNETGKTTVNSKAMKNFSGRFYGYARMVQRD